MAPLPQAASPVAEQWGSEARPPGAPTRQPFGDEWAPPRTPQLGRGYPLGAYPRCDDGGEPAPTNPRVAGGRPGAQTNRQRSLLNASRVLKNYLRH